MANVPYKGDSLSKGIARSRVWQRHRHLLGEPRFRATPHLFLASRIAGDVDVLRDMGAPVRNICAVENDREEYSHLFDRRNREGWRLFTEKVETVVPRFDPDELRSVYLDYCGNIQGTALTTRSVVRHLPRGAVLSVTLFLGREHECPEDREADLLDQVSDATRHPVKMAQYIRYTSADAGSVRGAAMGVWTFYLGRSARAEMVRLDLRDQATA